MPTAEMPMHYVNREEWGAKPPLKELPAIQHPIHYVRFTFTGDFKGCRSSKKCTERVKQLQEHDQTESNLPDIQPNFLVAGDGYVYEGRGWRVQPEKIFNRPEFDGKFIEVCYIGDYSNKPPTNEMLHRSRLALEIGTHNKFLDKDFEILNLGGPEYPDIGKDEPRFE